MFSHGKTNDDYYSCTLIQGTLSHTDKTDVFSENDYKCYIKAGDMFFLPSGN